MALYVRSEPERSLVGVRSDTARTLKAGPLRSLGCMGLEMGGKTFPWEYWSRKKMKLKMYTLHRQNISGIKMLCK